MGLTTSLRVWVTKPNYMLSPEGTECFFLYGIQICVTLPTHWWGRCSIFTLAPDVVTRKLLPSTIIPSLALLSINYDQNEPMELGFWIWSFGYNPLSTPNSVIDKQGFGYTFTRAFFPCYRVTELEKSIRIFLFLYHIMECYHHCSWTTRDEW